MHLGLLQGAAHLQVKFVAGQRFASLEAPTL